MTEVFPEARISNGEREREREGEGMKGRVAQVWLKPD